MNPQLTKCPTCASRKIKVIRSDFNTKAQGRTVVVADLERQECSDCGEILFDCAAMERLEAARSLYKRRVSHAGK